MFIFTIPIDQSPKRARQQKVEEMYAKYADTIYRIAFVRTLSESDSEDILLMQAAAQEAIGWAPQVRGSCLSDLSVISKYGSDRAFAMGCGRDFSQPGGAHQPNEFIECDALVDFTKTVGAYILKKLG